MGDRRNVLTAAGLAGRLPRWPAVSSGAMPNMLFDTRCAVVGDPDAKERAALAA